ncbi:3-ketoacyl-ACP reductase [Actinomycetospora sp. NBRC 106375]|uniref:mycofactocin-coupled SDR family oxidoreductase n=1 Tax=Actinomycetospora sp. NBRC 106375 TaxID=3032207 RepID=UPI0024A52B28|nr:mycofactocin-coupled SDR family oxidoreductase [Actinomycetospora sp. NBRC 106375]GLZ45860.1 3-ketoacyl-ACP reductase [Actinomycetospora sp. NBRC 106375]
MGQLDGKVAFITGAARGQGRSHALRLAQEGADIIGVDLCEQVDTVQYAGATPEDLAETAKRVEDLDRRIVTRQADVRDHRALSDAFEAGIAELGRVDIILANAGIANQVGGEPEDEFLGWQTVIDINLTGVYNTVKIAAPRMIEQGDGGAIVLTSSTQGLSGRGGDGGGAMSGYAAAKHGVVGLMRTFAHWLAPHSIRVNTVHPTGVNTPMVVNPQLEAWMAANPEKGDALTNLMPVEMVEPVDISNAILYLVSDAGRYVSGVTLPVDAGFCVK